MIKKIKIKLKPLKTIRAMINGRLLHIIVVRVAITDLEAHIYVAHLVLN